jgi:hypothetical protein
MPQHHYNVFHLISISQNLVINKMHIPYNLKMSHGWSMSISCSLTSTQNHNGWNMDHGTRWSMYVFYNFYPVVIIIKWAKKLVRQPKCFLQFCYKYLCGAILMSC